jgi:hypothetical protein
VNANPGKRSRKRKMITSSNMEISSVAIASIHRHGPA